ncbi:hypothetical protein CSPX01_12507 [Colletotrichum filicis]|nr:hypothetical protein CSPX01_12507 [Colletotrichum filicis]
MAGPGWFVWGGLMPSFSVFSRVQGSTSMYVCMYGECVCTEKVWGKRGTVGQGLPFVSSCFTFLQASSLCASLHRARLVSLWPDSTACSLLMWHVLRRAPPWSWASLSQRMVSELSLFNAIPAHACVTHLPTLHVAALHQAAGPTIYFALSLSLSLTSRLPPLPCLWLMLLVLLTLLLLLLPHTGHHHNSAPVFVRFSPLGMVSLALMYFGCLGLPPLPPVKHPHPPPKHTHSLTPPSFHLATLGCDGDVWIDQVTRG